MIGKCLERVGRTHLNRAHVRRFCNSPQTRHGHRALWRRSQTAALPKKPPPGSRRHHTRTKPGHDGPASWCTASCGQPHVEFSPPFDASPCGASGWRRIGLYLARQGFCFVSFGSGERAARGRPGRLFRPNERICVNPSGIVAPEQEGIAN